MQKQNPVLNGLFILILALVTREALADDAPKIKVQLVTEELPPLQTQTKRGVEGYTLDLLREVLATTGDDYDVQLMPWARAYQKALKEPNVLIFSITRLPSREALFHWIGPIGVEVNAYFWTLKTRPELTFTNLKAARSFKTVVPRVQPELPKLLSHGFREGDNLTIVNNLDQSIPMLLTGRVDFIYGGDLYYNYLAAQGKLNLALLNKRQDEDSISDILYLAFSLATPKERVSRYQAALRQVHDSGYLSELRRKWFSSQP